MLHEIPEDGYHTPTQSSAEVIDVIANPDNVSVKFKTARGGEEFVDSVPNENGPKTQKTALLQSAGLSAESNVQSLVGRTVPVCRENVEVDKAKRVHRGPYRLDLEPQNGVGWKVYHRLKRFALRHSFLSYGCTNAGQMYVNTFRVGYRVRRSVGFVISAVLAFLLALASLNTSGVISDIFAGAAFLPGMIALGLAIYFSGRFVFFRLVGIVIAATGVLRRTLFPVERFSG